MTYFFDSYAIIKSLLNEGSYAKYKEEHIITNSLHLSEVAYFFLRTGNKALVERLPQLDIAILEITKTIAFDAATFKFKHRTIDLSYADCIGYMTSKHNHLKFLTGDFPFKQFENVEFVK